MLNQLFALAVALLLPGDTPAEASFRTQPILNIK